jgi:hypothetical protein
MTRLRFLRRIAVACGGLSLIAAVAPRLAAQSDPTLVVAPAGDATKPEPGTAGPFTLTATCPANQGPHCAVWVEQDTTATGPRVDIQWRLVTASTACPSHVPVDFHDVVVEPQYPIALIPKGASCTLTLTFRLKSPGVITDDVARNVSLYITR